MERGREGDLKKGNWLLNQDPPDDAIGSEGKLRLGSSGTARYAPPVHGWWSETHGWRECGGRWGHWSTGTLDKILRVVWVAGGSRL